MLVSKKKDYLIFFYLILIILLIFILLLKAPGLKGGIDQAVRILTKNPIILDGRYPIKQSLPNVKVALKDLLSLKKKNFETLKIDINYKNFDKLKKDRAKALKVGMLENPTKVDLELNWQGKKIFASARLKGDFNDHRNFNKQWSLKFNLKNSENIDGMTEFSITNHRSRNFPYNFIISKNLERMGLHVPKFKTVKVNFNGYDWGVMLIEEHFTKEFLENRKLKNNLIFKLSSEEKMRFEHLYLYKGIINNDDYAALTKWQDIFNVYYHNEKKNFDQELTYETKDFMTKLSLMKSLNETINLKNINTESELIERYFDLESFAKMLVSGLAWGEAQFHSMELNNTRFYINPYTLKITPIPADYEFIFKMHGGKINETNVNNYLNVIAGDLLYLPPLYQPIFWNDKFQNLYLEALYEFEKNLPNIIIDTNTICSSYNKICNNIVNLDKLKERLFYLKIFKKKIFKVYMDKYAYYHDSRNKLFYKYLKENDFNQANYFNLYNDHLYARLFDNGDLKVINLTNSEINIVSVEIEKINFKKKINLKINGSKYNEIEVAKLNLDFKPEINSSIKLDYSFIKNNDLKSYKTYVEHDIDLLDQNTKFYDFGKNNILIKENNIIFENKEYIIDKPILVPENHNLIILAGADLKFSENSNILIYNGSLKILGEKNNNVNISALENTWSGIYVIGNNKNSEINYANFSKLNYFQNSKFNLSGAINFYNSNVEINNSVFDISNSEDSINFIKSKFSVNDTTFSNTKSDAIDSDYSIGSIKNSKFINIGGDAIDTSGSNVEIFRVKILNVGDKGISAGEESIVTVSDILIDNAKIGIASKDSSKVLGNNLVINNSREFDLASYNKKKIFGGGSIEVKKIVSENKYLSQKNSIIKIDQKKIIEKKFNTKDLY